MASDGLRAQITRLRAQVNELQGMVHSHGDQLSCSSRSATQHMAPDPSEDNPYRGVMASGVPNFEVERAREQGSARGRP